MYTPKTLLPTSLALADNLLSSWILPYQIWNTPVGYWPKGAMNTNSDWSMIVAYLLIHNYSKTRRRNLFYVFPQNVGYWLNLFKSNFFTRIKILE